MAKTRPTGLVAKCNTSCDVLYILQPEHCINCNTSFVQHLHVHSYSKYFCAPKWEYRPFSNSCPCAFFLQKKKRKNQINAKIAVAGCTDHTVYTSNLPISISNLCRCPNIPLPSITVSDCSDNNEPLKVPHSWGGRKGLGGQIQRISGSQDMRGPAMGVIWGIMTQ